MVRAVSYSPQCNPIKVDFAMTANNLKKYRFTNEDEFNYNIEMSMP